MYVVEQDLTGHRTVNRKWSVRSDVIRQPPPAKPVGGTVRARKILDVVFGLLAASFAAYVLFPRFRNNFSCDNSVPTNSAQSAALADARSRKAPICSGSQRRCKFVIDEDPEGSIRVSLYFVETNFFDGCTFKGQDSDVFLYSREGKFVRIEASPYAY